MQIIWKEFELDPEEDILDDFGCTMMATKVSSTAFNVVHHGRIYLTDERLCFGSDILGLKNKFKLEFTKITAISKTKILGLFDSGILIEYDKENLYTIGGL